MTTDIHRELRKYQKELSDQKYALDQSAIVAITDNRGLITYVNDMFCDISQYSRLELIGNTHSVVNSKYHSHDFFASLWKTISSGRVWKGEIQNRAKDGSIYWVDTTIVPLLDEKKKPRQYVAIRYDITNRKDAELRLEDERARALTSEKMASLGMLASGIAHELGNPLAAIQGRLDMIKKSAGEKDLDPKSVQESIQKCQHLVDRMTRIIRGLRSYARDGSNDPFSPVSMSALIADVLEFSKNRLSKMGIRLTEKGLAEKDLNEFIILGRETEIGQVIVNLLNNAADAVANAKEKVIEVELKLLENQVEVSITDTGSGFTPEAKKKLFMPFFTTKPVGSGTGLGLTISKNIVDKHGGKFFLDEKSERTRFVIQLPLVGAVVSAT
jgi:PAS domain S-box-containing protein